jgi:hypothetical protein
MTAVERPIVMSGHSVRAILSGFKTQTRRLITVPRALARRGPQLDRAFADKAFTVTPCLKVPLADDTTERLRNPWGFPNSEVVAGEVVIRPSVLWVRETWRTEELPDTLVDGVRFQADHYFQPIESTTAAAERWVGANNNRQRPAWRSPRFMPRWVARLELEITDVRAERLQAISEDDARAEGGGFDDTDGAWPPGRQYGCVACSGDPRGIASLCHDQARGAPYRCCYAHDWDSMHKRLHPWWTNPWVWVVTFKPRLLRRVPAPGAASLQEARP